MSSFRQVWAVTAVSLLGIRRRLGACLVIVIGIAGVVAVLVSVFAMARGFSQMTAKTGRDDRVMILAGGAETEANSGLSRADVAAILNAGEIRTGPSGRPVASADTLVSLRLTDRKTGLDAFATLRGVGPEAGALRPEIRLVEGRLFGAGVNELIVGRALQRRLDGLDVGRRLRLPQGEWTIVGAFATDGDVRESELLADVETVFSAYNRNTFNSVNVSLRDGASLETLRAYLASQPGFAVKVEREREYLARVSEHTKKTLTFIATFIGGIMMLGAALAAINAMYSSIGSRSLEIATLRAVGYDGLPVLVSVFIEALAFALLGAALGATAAWQFFNGNVVSLLSSAGPAPVAFALKVSPGLVAMGIASACAIGLVGGLFAAVRVARAPIAVALRS
jgi:putative ABC transport system permease protein